MDGPGARARERHRRSPSAAATEASGGTATRGVPCRRSRSAVQWRTESLALRNNMARVKRLIKAATIALFALAPMTASAAPLHSPGLDTELAAPPSGYAELTSSPFHGLFTAHDYAQASGSSKADQIEQTLNHDGFVSGFGKTWIHQASAHALVEAVIVFTGAKGAKDWLISAEAGDKSDPTYAHADAISGISPYYGGHFKYKGNTPAENSEGDVFSFV